MTNGIKNLLFLKKFVKPENRIGNAKKTVRDSPRLAIKLAYIEYNIKKQKMPPTKDDSHIEKVL